jgi:16S rRNA (guanine527-N7)-methyltransferase
LQSTILDIGTGGGFPGIPLAILFPEVEFHLVDSIGKKIKVVQEVAKSLGLKNLTSEHTRAENVQKKYDFIVSRAVTQMPEFLRWTKNKISATQKNTLQNGILYLKGGDLSEELKNIPHKIFLLSDVFEEDFFETKKLVYVKI